MYVHQLMKSVSIMMQITILLLPALALLCYGAALPQVIGTPLPSSRPTTYTFVIPCPPGAQHCAPKTVTLVAGDELETRTVLPGDAQVIIDESKTTSIPPSCPTSTYYPPTGSSKGNIDSDATQTIGARQALGSPSRTTIVTPTATWGFPGWPWWPKSDSSAPVDKREPQGLGRPTRTVIVSPTGVPGWPWWPNGDTAASNEKREPQGLGKPTRTVIVSPTGFPGWPWWPKKADSETVDKREPQLLGDPTRTTISSPTGVPGWPWWPTDADSETVEKREPQLIGDPTRTAIDYPTGFPGWPRSPLDDDASNKKREPQTLEVPTRTVLASPTPATVTVTITTTYYPGSTLPWWWPHPHTRLTTTAPEATTRTVPPLTVPTLDRRDPQVLGSPTRTPLISPTPKHTKKPHPPPPKPTTTYDNEKRQELGDPTGTVSWYTGGDDGLTATVTLGAGKRQELGDPTESITWWGGDDPEPTVVLEPPTKRRERRRNRIQLS